jgi:high affinity Mn2+ porin
MLTAKARSLARACAFLLVLGCCPALAQEEAAFEVHGQATYIRQYKPSFPASYTGPNSLRPERERGYTLTSTVFLGARLGDTELYLNPEFVAGVPLSELHGLGGFTDGENQRGAGERIRSYRARLFLRQTWNLGGAFEEQASDQNQVKTRHAAERVVLTVGNLSVLDVFDVMDYSRDARTQFMNWASLTYGAWDYAADSRGYTWGAALEYISPGWQARAGRFLVPVESNGLRLDWAWRERYGDAAELEAPYTVAGRSGVVRAMVFRNRVNAGAFSDALAAGTPPDVATVRRTQTKRGFGLSTQLEVTQSIGAFIRAGWSDGRTETFMFTEIDRSLAVGTLVKGTPWARPDDKLGVAAYLHGLSSAHRTYLASGGLGFFLGDGQLNYGSERILETFYSLGVVKGVSVSPGYQRIWNPGYNRDRGPVHVLALRLHAEF